MPEAAIDQHADDEQGERCAEGFEEPQGSAFQATHQHLHPDVAAKALAIGRAQKRHARHREFNEVDVAGDGRVEDRPKNDLQHPQHHQHDNRKRREQVCKVFDRDKRAVQAAQEGPISVGLMCQGHPYDVSDKTGPARIWGRTKGVFYCAAASSAYSKIASNTAWLSNLSALSAI